MLVKHAGDGQVALATAKQHTAAQLDIKLYDRKIPVKYCIEVVRFQGEKLCDDEHDVGQSRFAEIRITYNKGANQQEILCSDRSSLAWFY